MARQRRKGHPIHGWLVVDKPQGMTSTAAVGAVKRITKAQKVGHGGTLDPLATGVLPIAMGEATKSVSFVMDATKRYRFTIRLGEARDTDDAEGEVTATAATRPEDAEIRAVLPGFTGTIMQRPPAYAAIKVQGERAYDIARRGETVELEPRPIRIDELDLVERPDPDHAVLEALCGRGAYIRALARDIGEQLGCLAHVSALRRLAVGALTAEQAISLEALEQLVENDTLPQALVSVATALAGIPAFAVTEPQAHRLRSGQKIRISPQLVVGEAVEGGPVKAMREGRVVALTRLEESELSPVRVFQP